MSIAHHARYLWYLFAGATSVRSLQLGEAWWDAEYDRGGLARTEGDVELPRHLLVASLIRHYAPGGAILDVGCGTGGLMLALGETSFVAPFSYLGLDLSEQGLQVARARVPNAGAGEGRHDFVRADFETYEPGESFDAVAFSESLYYAPDPARTVQRYAAALHTGGILAVSMWRRPSRRRVWKAIGAGLRELSRSQIVVPSRPPWDIVIYARSR